MDNDSPIDVALTELGAHVDEEAFPPKFAQIIKDFARQYVEICKEHSDAFKADCERLKQYLHFVRENAEAPYEFSPYHAAVRTPFDYHTFSIAMVAPLVDTPHSTLLGKAVLAGIEEQLARKENVVLFANHQSEADPQALAILLREHFPALVDPLTFVAGSRVTSDPMAIPFSMGCNLLCIHSKRHIENPPEKKQEKLAHNQKTMGVLKERLKAGGAFIYVAPSGGRDRKNNDGHIEVAQFDAGSIALFYLLAKKAKVPTHFYPLSLSTYSLLPPPPSVGKELGEPREINWGPIHAHFLAEIDMENFPGSDIPRKEEQRMARATHIHSIVAEAHEALLHA